jgi:hypothetical protein
MCDAGRARQAKAKAVLGRGGRMGRHGTTMAMAEAAGGAATASTLLGPGGVYSDMAARGVELDRSAGHTSSRYIGVSWHKASSSWMAQLYEPLTQHYQHIGTFASEEDAARAYDCAAVQAHGQSAKLNFPDEAISELPETVGEKRKQRESSRYLGVSWVKARSSWNAKLWDPTTKRQRHVGRYASEEDAARAYDCAAVQAHGPGARRNFPDEASSEMPVTVGVQKKQRSSSRYIGEAISELPAAAGEPVDDDDGFESPVRHHRRGRAAEPDVCIDLADSESE